MSGEETTQPVAVLAEHLDRFRGRAGGLAQAVPAPLFGTLYDRFGPRPLAVPGMALMSRGFWLQFAVGGVLSVLAVLLALTIQWLPGQPAGRPEATASH